MAALREELQRYIQNHNEHTAKPFVWTSSAEPILDTVARVKASQGQRTSRAGHQGRQEAHCSVMDILELLLLDVPAPHRPGVAPAFEYLTIRLLIEADNDLTVQRY